MTEYLVNLLTRGWNLSPSSNQCRPRWQKFEIRLKFLFRSGTQNDSLLGERHMIMCLSFSLLSQFLSSLIFSPLLSISSSLRMYPPHTACTPTRNVSAIAQPPLYLAGKYPIRMTSAISDEQRREKRRNGIREKR